MAVRMKVSKKHQIAVPSAVRKQLGTRSGDRFLVELRGATRSCCPRTRTTVSDFVGCTPRSGKGSNSRVCAPGA
jgi:AbrB family looped-hinge helix DNA binding protein